VKPENDKEYAEHLLKSFNQNTYLYRRAIGMGREYTMKEMEEAFANLSPYDKDLSPQ
jgi:hypothetical protein